MPKPKKILKIIGGVIIFFTLPSLLFFAFMYLKYNEDLPTGEQGEAANQLATKMLNALDHEAYQDTDYIEFTFKKRHHFKWNKAENTCEVYWKNIRVDLDLSNHDKSKVFISEESYNEDDAHDYIDKAVDLFNNDTFWLVAPYKVFDPGVERRLVITEENKAALLVTYTNGGSTPGDSYLWHFDEYGKPTSYQMWVDILPIDGLEASWDQWTTTDTGAQLPTFHKFLFMGLEIEDVKTLQVTKDTSIISKYSCFFEGHDSDIIKFLNIQTIMDSIELTVYGNIFSFSKHDSQIVYKYDSENNTLNTFQPKSVSAQIEPYRKYNAEMVDSNTNGFILKISSKGNAQSKMTEDILLECNIIK